MNLNRVEAEQFCRLMRRLGMFEIIESEQENVVWPISRRHEHKWREYFWDKLGLILSVRDEGKGELVYIVDLTIHNPTPLQIWSLKHDFFWTLSKEMKPELEFLSGDAKGFPENPEDAPKGCWSRKEIRELLRKDGVKWTEREEDCGEHGVAWIVMDEVDGKEKENDI